MIRKQEIADIYYVTGACISRIINKKRWEHLGVNYE